MWLLKQYAYMSLSVSTILLFKQIIYSYQKENLKSELYFNFLQTLTVISSGSSTPDVSHKLNLLFFTFQRLSLV